MGTLFKSENPAFADLRKPVQAVKVHESSVELLQDHEIYTMTEEMKLCIVAKLDKYIIDSIISVAKANGITNLLLLNKTAIIQALREYEERYLDDDPLEWIEEPHFAALGLRGRYFVCPRCNVCLPPPPVEYPDNFYRFCPRCGKMLNPARTENEENKS